MSKYKVIGLTGVSGAGKDTVADIAISKFKANEKVKITKPFKDLILKGMFEFSDYNIHDSKGKAEWLEQDIVLDHRKLRHLVRLVTEKYNDIFDRVVKSAYTIPISAWEGHKFVAGKNTYRDVAKFLSTEVVRSIIPDWHVQMSVRSIPTEGVTFVTDVRFKNEYDEFKKRFGDNFDLIYVKNEEAERKAAPHSSEDFRKELQGLKYETIVNDGTDLDALEAEAAKVMSGLMGVKDKQKSKQSKRGGRSKPNAIEQGVS